MDWASRTTTITIKSASGLLPFRMFDNPLSQAVNTAILEGKTYPIMDFVKDVKVIIDVGANVGAASIHFALRYREAIIYAFEPWADSFRLLSQNVAALPRIRAFDFGLLDSDCRMPLYLSNLDAVTNSVSSSPLNSGRFVEICLRDAAAVCRQEQIQAIDVLKIDTEGCELAILESLAGFLDKIKVIYLEYHDEADRLAIDGLLKRTHILTGAKVIRPHLGELCYVAYQAFPSLAHLEELRIRGVRSTPP